MIAIKQVDIMGHPVEELYGLLVPLHQARLIVPRSCVAEIIRYSPLQSRGIEAPDWFRGFVGWNNLQVPVISIEDLCDMPSTEPAGRTRITIFNGLSKVLSGRVFGLLTEGFPQLLRINSKVMELHEEHVWPDDGPIICQIRMINEYPLVPDLEVIESLVQEQVINKLGSDTITFEHQL
ncbi:MAG: chemotaxis protein CheW [Gammaproteobacteria bacterium]|nr:chemotaxis protein CheW [Gammaproteobacteria bacterium]